MRAQLSVRVTKLTAALSWVGDASGAEAQVLQSVLDKAKNLLVESLDAQQFNERRQFLERAKKRWDEPKEEVVAAQQREVQFQQGLSVLMASVGARCPAVSVSGDTSGRISDLEIPVRQLRRECGSLWVANSAVVVDNVPPLPAHAQDVEEWIRGRNCELRNALEFGDATLVSQIADMGLEGQ